MSKHFITLCTTAILILVISVTAIGQDRHFSQFYAAPLSLNPAMTGQFEGKYRGILNYRRQWNSFLERPFNTMGLSADGNFRISKSGKYPDKLGLGVTFYSDNLGSQSYSTDQIGLSGAFHKSLDFKGTHYISAGYQLNLVQKSINFNGLTFNDQFDGINGYNLSTEESLPVNTVGYADMSAGIFWSLVPTAKVAVYAGLGLHHFNVPDASYYENPEVEPDRIFMKTTIQGGLRYKISNFYDIEPRFVVFLQGPHIEANVGANLRIALDDYSTRNLYVGAWLRPVSDVDGSFTLDALVGMLAFRQENVQVGLSYDVNTSSLTNSTQGRGGFEFSASFIGFYEDDNIICPQF